MKKIILFTAFILCASLVTLGQKDGKTKLSLGPELGITVGTYSNNWGLGIGGSLQLEHFFQENVSGAVFFGIVSYIGKSYNNGTNSLKYKAYTVVPIRIGARYYIGDGFHLGAQAGLGIVSNGGGTAFAFSPQVGYNFKTNNNKAIDFSLKYDSYSKSGTFSALGIRIAYIF